MTQVNPTDHFGTLILSLHWLTVTVYNVIKTYAGYGKLFPASKKRPRQSRTASIMPGHRERSNRTNHSIHLSIYTLYYYSIYSRQIKW